MVNHLSAWFIYERYDLDLLGEDIQSVTLPAQDVDAASRKDVG